MTPSPIPPAPRAQTPRTGTIRLRRSKSPREGASLPSGEGTYEPDTRASNNQRSKAAAAVRVWSAYCIRAQLRVPGAAALPPQGSPRSRGAGATRFLLQAGKPRYREVRSFTRGLTAGRWQRRNLNFACRVANTHILGTDPMARIGPTSLLKPRSVRHFEFLQSRSRSRGQRGCGTRAERSVPRTGRWTGYYWIGADLSTERSLEGLPSMQGSRVGLKLWGPGGGQVPRNRT